MENTADAARCTRDSGWSRVPHGCPAPGDGSTLLGAIEHDLVGMVGVRRNPHSKTAHKALIWGLFVGPQYRGRGLGARLLEEAIAHARSLDGVAFLNLTVSEAAEGARRLHEKAGFHVWAVEPDSLRHDGRILREFDVRLGIL